MTPKSGFSIKLLKDYEWPVDVKIPFVNADGEGDYETHRFIGVFKHLKMDEVNEMLAGLQEKIKQVTADVEANEASGLRTAEIIASHQVDLYMGIWTGWRDDLTGEDDKPLAYSEEAKRQLLGQKMIREAVMKAHQDSQGGEAARLKNSMTSAEAGQVGGES